MEFFGCSLWGIDLSEVKSRVRVRAVVMDRVGDRR